MQKLSSSEYCQWVNTKPAFENWLKGVELKIERRWKNEVNIVNFWGFHFITRS